MILKKLIPHDLIEIIWRLLSHDATLWCGEGCVGKGGGGHLFITGLMKSSNLLILFFLVYNLIFYPIDVELK